MFKAEHQKMYQEANQGLIAMRQAEIDYYMRVNATIGTQSALVGGFCYLTFSQNLTNHYVYNTIFITIYFVSSAVTIGLSIHVIFTTLLVQLLGPGLALHGPIGSMARATEGMRVEQRDINIAFFSMMAFFALTTLLLFWVTMTFWASVVSSGAFIVMARYWLYYIDRINRRFYWDRSKDQLGNWKDGDMRDSADEPTIKMHVPNPLLQQSGDIEQGMDDAASQRGSFMERLSITSGADMAATGVVTTRGSIIDRISSLVGKQQDESRSSAPSSAPPQHIAVNPKDTAMQGFLTMNTAEKTDTRSKKVWERRYCVLNYRGELYWYRTKKDFQMEPTKGRINPRPLSLDEFIISSDRGDISDAASVVSSASQQNSADNAFIFILIPKDDPTYKHWQYKVDSEEELDLWLNIMQQVSPSSIKPAPGLKYTY